MIEREHSQNVSLHQKMENSIRQSTRQMLINDRKKLSAPFDSIYNERTATLDYRRNSIFHQNSDRLNSGSSNDTTSTSFSKENFSNQSQKSSTNNVRLPPIIKATLNYRQRRDSKNGNWMANLQQMNRKKSNDSESFVILPDKTSTTLFEQKPMENQIRKFLSSLPKYQGVQQGFDNFVPISMKNYRKPMVIH